MNPRTLIKRFLILCLLAPLSWLCAEKNQAEQEALVKELETLKAQLPKIHNRIKQINEELEELRKVQTYTRQIYLKLPLTQPRFHWNFIDRDNLLNNSLELIIRNSKGETRTTIFSEGRIHEDWKNMRDGHQSEENSNEIYFGFISKKHFDINRFDTAEMILNVKQDIQGIGPEIQGYLPKGNYHAIGKFKIFDLEPEEGEPQFAYLTKDLINESNWSETWDLVITEKSGWLDQRSSEETENNMRKHIARMHAGELEFNKKLANLYNDPDTNNFIIAYEQAMTEVITNELSQPAHYWKKHSPREIRTKYGEIIDSVQKLKLRNLPTLPGEELPPELEALKAATSEEIKKHYKQSLLEILKDVL